jgi:phospholipid/cholesterol/gamma-HCH transport system permease protein
MSVTAAPRPPLTRRPEAPAAPPPPRPDRFASSQRLVDTGLGWIEQVAGMMLLTGKAAVATFTPPYSWKEEFIEESFLILRRCLLPMIIAVTAFAFGAPGVQASNITSIFGSVDREGAFFVMASVRELAGWINGMVIAGVGGTAICADLGARKVRDELDALAVLGLDPVREVVTPRFLALGIITPLMNLIAVVFGVIGGWMAAVLVWGVSSSGYIATFTSNFSLPDLLGAVLKTTVFGFIIAIACCYKGMNVKGGAEGVGRAVNQAVVIAFAGIWVFDYMFTSILLAAFPETANLH